MQGLLRFLYTLEVPRLGGAPLQAGALCWRRRGDEVEVLLVTGRRSGKWGVPRGWALLGRPLHRTAAREAWEEAGVSGPCENCLLGLVDAPKSYGLVGEIGWKLALYPLEVRILAKDWPERGQRERQWFSPSEAADRVRPRALAAVVENFVAPTTSRT